MNVIVHLLVYVPACIGVGVVGYMYQDIVRYAVRRVARNITGDKQ